MGQAGRARVEKEYALQVTTPRLIRILRDLVEKRRQNDRSVCCPVN